MKTPIVITSLEEDFKKIGLIKAESAPVVDDTEELAEKNTAKRHATVTREGKKVRTQKQSTAEKMAGKKRRRSSGFKAWAKKYARKLKRFAKKIARRAAKAIKMGTRKKGDYGMRMGMGESFDAAEALKSHANLAIIAEKLSTNLAAVAEECETQEMGEAADFRIVADYYAALAEELAGVAQGLHESAEFDTEALTESFNEALEDVLDAVDLHEEMESDDEEEEDEDMEDEEEESDDEGND